jgi:hypothetical protein
MVKMHTKQLQSSGTRIAAALSSWGWPCQQQELPCLLVVEHHIELQLPLASIRIILLNIGINILNNVQW